GRRRGPSPAGTRPAATPPGLSPGRFHQFPPAARSTADIDPCSSPRLRGRLGGGRTSPQAMIPGPAAPPPAPPPPRGRGAPGATPRAPPPPPGPPPPPPP